MCMCNVCRVSKHMIKTSLARLAKLWFDPDELAAGRDKIRFLMLDAAPKEYRQLDDRKAEVIDQAAKDGEKFEKEVQAYLFMIFGGI